MHAQTEARRVLRVGGEPALRRTGSLSLSGLTIVLVLLDATLRGAGLGAEFPGNLEFDMRAPVNGFVQSVITVPALFKATEAATWAAYTFLLNPISRR